MQAIARETNLSETTFVLPPEKREDAASVDRAVSRGDALTAVLDPHGLPPVLLFAAVGPTRLYSRMFGPHSATCIAEDPATGSASGPLGAIAVRYGLVPRAAEVAII